MIIRPDGYDELLAENAALRAQNRRLKDLLREFVDSDVTPDSNCSCHISAPCQDCLDYALTRSLIRQARATLEETKMSCDSGSVFFVPPQQRDPVSGEWLEPAYDFGLTKRELFAAVAMQGLCSNPELTRYFMRPGSQVATAELSIAEFAVNHADALIAELKKVQP